MAIIRIIFIVLIIVTLILSFSENIKHAMVLRDKNAVIYDLIQDNNGYKNKNISLLQALKER